MTPVTMLIWVAATVATIAGPAAPGPSQSTRFAGRPVAEVLRELQSADLRIIFSSDLVPSELRVLVEPKSREPRQIAAEILEPHGLGLQNGPRGTLLVVVRPRTDPPKTSPKGSQPKHDQPGEEAASQPDAIRIEERVDVSDRLSDVPRPAGGYTIRSEDVRETAGAMENVFVPLQILPGSAATNDEDGRIAVRGAGPEYNLVVLDTRRVLAKERPGESKCSCATRGTVSAGGSGMRSPEPNSRRTATRFPRISTVRMH